MEKQDWMLLGSGAGVGAGVGAGLMYLLDPQGGKRRRALARDKAVSAAHKSGDSLRKASKHVGDRGKGIYAVVGSHLHKDKGEVSDRTLRDRVRSALGHHVSKPRAIAVDVEDGKVTLGGPVLTSELTGLLAAVEEIQGVQGILNHLEAYESAEGVPELRSGGVLSKSVLAKTRTLPPAMGLLVGGAFTLAGLKQRGRAGATLSRVGLGLLATSGFAGGKALLRRRASTKLGEESITAEPLRDEEEVPAQGTEEGTFRPTTL
jgi:hypothetical protein